jgi:diphthamide biosynthesis methyltransferase
MAARYFLNAIDRVVSLVEKYKKELSEIEIEIPAVRELAQKPFNSENELLVLKGELEHVEEEIRNNIIQNQSGPNEPELEVAGEDQPPSRKLKR